MDRNKQFYKRKETIYQFICDPAYTPMRIKDIALVLQIPKELRPDLEAVLEELVADGKVYLSGRGKYSKAEKILAEGEYLTTRKDFGFVHIDGEDEDIFIHAKHSNGAMLYTGIYGSLKKLFYLLRPCICSHIPVGGTSFQQYVTDAASDCIRVKACVL